MNESIEALGWTLVHFCWQAAAVALVYRIIDVAFSRSRSSIRYAWALGAMMSLLAVSLMTFGYEEWRIAHDRTQRGQNVTVTEAVSTYITGASRQV